VSFECRLSEIVQLKRADGEKAEAWLTLGEVVAVHIDKAFIKEGVYQTALKGGGLGRRFIAGMAKGTMCFSAIPRSPRQIAWGPCSAAT
jgi:hypothetical protein